MTIFSSYTGNAMLNNALMTIEALANLSDVSEITPEVLLRIYNDKDLVKLNKRMKSYTMLFTKNGPLHNDKANGTDIYNALFKTISNEFENQGELTCEISGLKFQTPFSEVFEKALRGIGISEKEIKKKDTNIGRTWVPLIGGLGSDAQALPQAKFTVQIHPICIAILQFLPLSSFLYNGGILLIDSSNFEFTRGYIADNVLEIEKRIKSTKLTDPIENIKEFSKGNYLLKAIKILKDKSLEENYSDLNLWSFSNSGTGASCAIDRVPNNLIQKLLLFIRQGSAIRTELERVLSRNELANSFLTSLEENNEWWGLYPNVFGKKKEVYAGVSDGFLEAYFEATGNTKLTSYAKYIAYLISKYKSKSFEKYLSSTSAWSEKTYRVDTYVVLVEATKQGEWSLNHQLQILDDTGILPVRNTFYSLHKLIHYFYQKQIFLTSLPTPENGNSKVEQACRWLIELLQKDDNKEKLIKGLTNSQEYIYISYTQLFTRSYRLDDISLESIVYCLYDERFLPAKSGINELLRIYFNQQDQLPLTFESAPDKIEAPLEHITKKWFEEFRSFADDYLAYYLNKYENKQTGRLPYGKLLKLLLDIPMDTSGFLYWFREAIENTNGFLSSQSGMPDQKWTEILLYDTQGESAISFAKLAIKFSLLKQYHLSLSQESTLIS